MGDLTRESPTSGNAPPPLTVRAVPYELGKPSVEAALELEARVFLEWFGNSRKELDEEYGYFAEQTTLILLEGSDLVGMMRVMLPGAHEAKTLVDARRPPFAVDVDATLASVGTDSHHVADLVTLAIDSRYRGDGLGPCLFAGALRAVEAVDVAWAVAMVDCSVRQYLARQGFDLSPFPRSKPQPYLGSPATMPVLLPVQPALVTALEYVEQLHRRIRFSS